MTLELTTCMEMVRWLKEFWNYTAGEDRKMLAHSLFDEVVGSGEPLTDTGQIVVMDK